MMVTLHKALAAAELRAPASAQGAFIPAKNSFDAFAALAKVLETATSDVLVVDPYQDETMLTEFAGAVSDKASIRLLADNASVKATLAPAATRWQTQFCAASVSRAVFSAKALA
jgi:hypothetical protein